MNITTTGLEGLFIIEPKVFGDSRGYFFESFNEKLFSEKNLNYHFVQDNESFSSYGTLRGLHFQKGEAAQAKFVRVLQGKVLDVVVDIRPDSKTFGEHFSIELSGENKKMMLIPRGFAHGFVVLSETALFSYKCDNFYAPKSEGGIIYNDPQLKIDWLIPENKMILSDKDKMNPTFESIKSSL
jgi:dTDP-4-dehydrorhamnose 3,5-epimerase